MFVLIHVGGLIFPEPPVGLAFDNEWTAEGLDDVGHTFAAHEVIRIVIVTARLLAREMESPRAVGVIIHHGKMVENIPVLRSGADLPSTVSDTFDRRNISHGPGHLVQA